MVISNDTPAASLPLLRTLIDAGADPNAQDKAGSTPLHVAAGIDYDPAVVCALLKVGADPNARNTSGQTPLYAAAGNVDNEDDSAVVCALLKAGADPNISDEAGRTPLYEAMANGNRAVEAALRDAGADVTHLYEWEPEGVEC